MAFRLTGFADEATKSLKGQIDVIKKLGWTGLEVRLVEGTNFCHLDDAKFEAAWDTLQSSGIQIVGYGAALANWARPITTDFQVDLDELSKNLPRMKKTGTKIIRCMSYPNDPKNPWPEAKWKAEAFKRLKELAKRCADAGVILGHENCNGYGGLGPKQSVEMFEAVNSPAFKLVLDTGNNSLHDNNNDVTWEIYKQNRKYLAHVHIKAAKPGPDGKWITCYPDEDPVQLRILKDLKATGYDGWLSIEPHMKAAVHAGKDVEDAAAATEVFLEYGRRIKELVAKA